MIYVHDNPQKIDYNSILYVFLRQWYTPELPNHTFKGDTWFKVPAVRNETMDKVSYTIINLKLEMSAMMIVSDNGRLLKANRVNLDQKVSTSQLEQIHEEAFDIPAWEKLHQKAFPYDLMFDSAEVNRRYRALNGTSTNAYFSVDSSNSLFKEIKRAVSPKPCNCGKAHYIG